MKTAELRTVPIGDLRPAAVEWSLSNEELDIIEKLNKGGVE